MQTNKDGVCFLHSDSSRKSITTILVNASKAINIVMADNL